MIGVALSRRRGEFMRFASEHLMCFEEIVDWDSAVGSSSSSEQKYDAIITDGEHCQIDGLPVIDIAGGDLDECLKEYSRDLPKQDVSQQKLRGILIRYFDELHKVPVRCTFDTCSMLLAEEDGVKDEVVAPMVFDSPIADTTSNTSKPAQLFEDEDIEIDLTSLPLAEQEPVVQPTFQQEPQQVEMPAPTVSQFPPQQFAAQQQFSPQQQFQPQQFSTQQQISAPSFGLQAQPQFGMMQTTQASFIEGRQQTQSIRRSQAVMSVRKSNTQHKKFQVPIYTFSSVTHKAGVTTVAYSLAAALAAQQPEARVLYLDLNLGNPNYISSLLNLNPNSDACVKTIMQLNETDFMQNLTFLTETVEISQIPFSMISLGQLSLLEKRSFANADYSYFIETLYNSFDVVLVDLGELQATLPYQASVLHMNSAKHFVVADCSDSKLINMFICMAQQLTFNYEVIVNKNIPQAGSFLLNQRLRRAPFASISLHRNVNRYFTGQLSIIDTALFAELSQIGGKL